MDKSQSPLFAELALGVDTQDSTTGIASKFLGTDNPRYLRVIDALMWSPLRRENIDTIAGTSNGPEVMRNLRRLGLSAPCVLISGLDRDGKPIRSGQYSFTPDDRRLVVAWLVEQQRHLGATRE